MYKRETGQLGGQTCHCGRNTLPALTGTLYEMHTKDFKVLCERFAIAYNPLHNSRKDGLLSQEKFKEICKSIAQQVAPAMLLGAQHLP